MKVGHSALILLAVAAATRGSLPVDAPRLGETMLLDWQTEQDILSQPYTPDDDDVLRCFDDQLLDHFDPTNRETFCQKYIVVNGTDRTEALLIVGQESPMTAVWVRVAKFIKREFNFDGYVFVLENRFYGGSRPHNALPYLPEIKRLSTEQVLADLATFTERVIETKYQMRKKPVVYSCSYAGAITAWYRIKYPQMSSGGVASSCPLRAESDFSEYLEKTISTTEAVLPGCVQRLRRAYAHFLDVATNDPRLFETKLNLCHTSYLNSHPNYKKVAQNIWQAITGQFMSYAQYGRSFPFIASKICFPLITRDVFYVVSKAFFPNGDCQSPFEIAPDFTPAQSRDCPVCPWLWQVCSEYGWLQTSTTTNDTFYVNPDLSSMYCKSWFGMSADVVVANTQYFNEMFGALDMSQNKRILVTNGQYDPWSTLSLPPNDVGLEGVRSTVTPKGHHCAVDFGEVARAIRYWLDNPQPSDV